MKLVRARAYASIANLVYGCDVFAVCVSAGFDEVELSLGGRGITLKVEGEEAGTIPTRPHRNTAGVALARLMRDHGLKQAVRLRIDKRIRSGGGLGSSAASAAAAVVAANRLFGLGLRRARLVSYADRKSTRLNSSHAYTSYAVFCLKKKNGLPSRTALPPNASSR